MIAFLTVINALVKLNVQNWGVACKRHASGQAETPDGDAFHEQICENEIQVLTCGPIQSYMINIKSVTDPRTAQVTLFLKSIRSIPRIPENSVVWKDV